MENFTEKTNGDVTMKVKANPDSESFEIEGVNKWTNRLEIKLSSSARKGEANKELIHEMENLLGKKVSIKTGHKSRKKLLLVKDASEDEVKERLDTGR